MTANFQTEGTYTPDGLLAGNAHLLVARKVTVLAGQVLLRGAVLGTITASGKAILSLAAATDGSETPDLILAEAVDATGGDAPAVAYERGDFNSGALTMGAGHTVASIRERLRAKGITLLAAVA